MRSIGSQRNAIEMHEKRNGDQAMWLNSVCGTRVLWLEPEGWRTRALQDVRQEASGEWTIQCQCEDSGQRALEENTVDNEVTCLTRSGGQAMFLPTAYGAQQQAEVQILSSIVGRVVSLSDQAQEREFGTLLSAMVQ